MTLNTEAFAKALAAGIAAYEAAVAINSEGWIEWSGGRRPVGKTEPVDVRFRNGEVYFNDFGWSWGHADGGFDIIAYRLAK